MTIVQIFPGKVWGGAEQYVLDLGNALSALGHNVKYIARPSQAVISRLSGDIEFSIAPMGGLFDRKSIGVLSEVLVDADLVHVHDIAQVAIVIKAIKQCGSKARVVLTRHIARASRTMPWNRSALKQLHRMIFVSNLGRNLWTSVNQWMPAEKCVTIHNSSADTPFKPAEDLRQKYTLDKDTPLLMFTGRIRKSKGCEILVRALAKVKHLKWKMVFVGTCKPADYSKQLLEIAQEFGIANRIEFYGFSDNVPALISQADVGIAPSIVREACPLAPIEFMQRGVCIIATNNGAQPEYISDGNTGLLVPPADVDALAEALQVTLTQPHHRAQIALAGQEYFLKEMSYSKFIESILSAYAV